MMKNRKSSHREKLSSDARIIIALLKKQPQTRNELCKTADIHSSTFYRNIHLLKGRVILKETEGGYALWTYIELEKAIETALDKLEKTDSVITFNKIASEVGAHPSEIDSIIYPIAKKRGMEVRQLKGEKVITRADKGAVLF
jgi:pyridoxine/pyridoxamine 5'-phosphate oxidase